MTLVDCEDVTKIYLDEEFDIQVLALRGINLSIVENDFISVIGPSGSGKTTLIRLLGGIERATTGTIIFDDTDLSKMSNRELVEFRRKEVGFLHQNPEDNLFMNLSARSNVLVPMEIAGVWGRTERHNKAKELLKAVGLQERARHTPGKMSGGEIQRLGLAVALANEPKLLLADEPTGELDSASTFKLLDYLWVLNQDLGTTMVVVTHDRRFAERTRVSYQIRDGQIVGILRAEDPESLKKREKTVREELGVVDPFGNIRLPVELQKTAGIKTYVRMTAEKNELTIRPAEDVEEPAKKEG